MELNPSVTDGALTAAGFALKNVSSKQATFNKEVSISVLSGGQSAKVVLGAGSVQSAASTTPTCLISPDVDVFVRAGANPTAVATGADQILFAKNTYRAADYTVGDLFAFIPVSGSTGNVYISPSA